MSEFFSTPAGIAVFSVIAAVVVIFIIEVNYKYTAKCVLDFICALVCVIVLSPLYAALAIASSVNLKKHGGGRILERGHYLGYKGKIVELYSYSLTSFNGEYLGTYADFLKNSHLKNLPRFLNVLQLRLSIIGIKPLAPRDGGFIEDDDYVRFNARVGLVAIADIKGNENLTYEEMFAMECRYVKRRELFYDIGLLLCGLVHLIRGDKTNRLGETDESDYCEVLLARGEITPEQLTLADQEAFQI